jgi:hypothetical protein
MHNDELVSFFRQRNASFYKLMEENFKLRIMVGAKWHRQWSIVHFFNGSWFQHGIHPEHVAD